MKEEEENKIGVALVKRRCIVCGKDYDAEIVMNTHLIESKAKEVKSLHGEVVGWLDKPCEECQKLMKMGIMVIVYDKDKTSEPPDITTIYRTGQQYVLTEDAVKRILEDKPEDIEEVLRKRIIVIDKDLVEEMGIDKIKPLYSNTD